MMHTLELARRATRLRTSAVVSGLLALFAGACNSADNLNPDPIAAANFDSVGTDSLGTADSLALADSLVTADSLNGLSLSSVTMSDIAMSEVAARRSSVPFGPFGLWAHYDRIKATPARFTASINYTDAYGIVTQINAARAKGQRLMLMTTDDGRSPYMTRGRFDLAKWKRRMDLYRKPAIRSAVAKAVANGTVLGNSVIDEPKNRSWNGSINKATVDQMCRYVKGIFPSLPVGVVTVHWWRPTERYRVCDFIIDQYDWWQPPMGPGSGGGGSFTAWLKAAQTQARKDGIAIAFSMNVLAGGIQNWKTKACPSSITGGIGVDYPSAPNCKMAASQIREWGRKLGQAGGCAMFMWKYDQKFVSKAANVQAFRDVAAALAKTRGRSCRRA